MPSFSGIHSGFAFLKDLHLLKVFFRVSLRFLSNFMQGLLQEFFQVFRGRRQGRQPLNIYIYASLTRTLLSQSTHIRYIWAQAPLLPETNRKGAAIATCIYICIYIYIHVCMYYVLCMYVCMYYVCMYVGRQVCMYVRACIYVDMLASLSC